MIKSEGNSMRSGHQRLYGSFSFLDFSNKAMITIFGESSCVDLFSVTHVTIKAELNNEQHD
jgi:hypothetical protein